MIGDNIRFIIRNNHDEDGITEEIIKEIGRYFKIERGIVYDCNLTSVRERCTGIEYRSAYTLVSHDNLEIRTSQEPIDGDILHKMLPYKSMAMHIMMRESHYDIYERAYLEDVYYRHLRYWNDLLDSEKINCVINMLVPHHCGEYILYALTQVKNIPYVVMYPQVSCRGILYNIGTNLESVGEVIKEKYESILEMKDVDLGPFMRDVVANVNENKVMNQDVSLIKIKKRRNMVRAFYKPGNFYHDIKMLLGIKLNIIKRQYKSLSIDAYKTRIKHRYKAMKYEKKMEHMSDYERLAQSIDLTKQYIYYPLQVSPEASTMPAAGEFKNQLLGIELVAKAAKQLGLEVYVKEHWVQPHREPKFYENINKIEKVKLVSEQENSMKLIENSVVVVSQTGNCLFEALIKGKSAIAISNGYTFKGAPNIIEANKVETIVSAIESILAGDIQITVSQRNKYLYAMESEMIFCYSDSLEETAKYYNKELSAKKIVAFIRKKY